MTSRTFRRIFSTCFPYQVNLFHYTADLQLTPYQSECNIFSEGNLLSFYLHILTTDLTFEHDYSHLTPVAGEALIRVVQVGLCKDYTRLYGLPGCFRT